MRSNSSELCRRLYEALKRGDTPSAVFNIFSINVVPGRDEDIRGHADCLAEIAQHVARASLPKFRPFALIALGPALRDPVCRAAITQAGLSWSNEEEQWRLQPEEATARAMRVVPLRSDELPFVHLVAWAGPQTDVVRYLRGAYFCETPPPELVQAAIKGWFARHGIELEEPVPLT